MLRRAWLAAATVVMLCLAGCAATGPKGSEIASLSSLAPGLGRAVFFRSTASWSNWSRCRGPAT